MDQQVLSIFYRSDGKKQVFLKSYFIRLIRNKIIDPNTQHFLSSGFLFKDTTTNENVLIPCDDSNWCEYLTFKEGFELGVLNFPFSIKLHNNYFYNINSYEEFLHIFKLIIDFRTYTIKKGWAIKYGVIFENIEYPSLENLSEEQLINWCDPRGNVKYNLKDIKIEDLK